MSEQGVLLLLFRAVFTDGSASFHRAILSNYLGWEN